MSSDGHILRPGELVLVTGVNGFLGSHIANCLLGRGISVRGTVRSADKAEWIEEAMSKSRALSSFSTIIVPDITAGEAWEEAVRGVNGIVHVAGDMSFGSNPNEIITPMVRGVRNLLRAAAKEQSVKRFVFTSSNRAISNEIIGKEIALDSSMWNEEAIKNAWRPPPYEQDRIWDIYAALKTQCEQEIWTFNREEKPHFVINSVLPCFTVGPIFHTKQPGSTGKWVMDFWRDPMHYEPLQNFGASWFVDVDDIALLHLAALTEEDVKDERLLGFAGPFNFNSWTKVFRQLNPSKPWPADDASQGYSLCKVDTTRELELLKRFGRDGWTSFYNSVQRACAESRV